MAPFSATATAECSSGVPQVRLSWSASGGADFYQVFRNGVLLEGVTLTNRTYLDAAVSIGVQILLFRAGHRCRRADGFARCDGHRELQRASRGLHIDGDSVVPERGSRECSHLERCGRTHPSRRTVSER